MPDRRYTHEPCECGDAFCAGCEPACNFEAGEGGAPCPLPAGHAGRHRHKSEFANTLKGAALYALQQWLGQRELGPQVDDAAEMIRTGRMAAYSDLLEQMTGRKCSATQPRWWIESIQAMDPVDSVPSDAVHPIGCVCETCSATYERESWDPRDRGAPVVKCPACGSPGKNYGTPRIVVTMRGFNCSAFNGYRRTPSRYSELLCLVCRRRWRSCADGVHRLPDATDADLAAIAGRPVEDPSPNLAEGTDR